MTDPERRRLFLWVATIAAVATVDVVVRFLLAFRLEQVLWAETVLFLAGGTVLVRLLPHAPTRSWLRMVQLLLAAGFLLGGLRAGLWAAGIPVAVANATILVAAVLAGTVAWFRGRKVRQS
jgi:hypothetical protein